jgi:hypothetical protein
MLKNGTTQAALELRATPQLSVFKNRTLASGPNLINWDEFLLYDEPMSYLVSFQVSQGFVASVAGFDGANKAG